MLSGATCCTIPFQFDDKNDSTLPHCWIKKKMVGTGKSSYAEIAFCAPASDVLLPQSDFPINFSLNLRIPLHPMPTSLLSLLSLPKAALRKNTSKIK